MLIKKKTTSTILTIVIVLLISGISLAAGFFLKSQILEQSVEAASINQPQAETQEEIIETRLESETSESQADTAVQTINGVEIRFEGASQEDGKVAVNVCFDLPDDSDWTLWNSTLELDGKTYRWSEMAPTEIRKPPVSGTQELWTFKPEGGVQIETVKVDLSQPGYRCETIYFRDVPESALSAPYTFNIEALEAAPRETDYCTNAYLQKVQAALDARQTGITVKCVKGENTGGLEVVTKPETMSQEDAQAFLGDPDFYLDLHGIRGPWVFTFTLD
jgi:hypothetical protein